MKLTWCIMYVYAWFNDACHGKPIMHAEKPQAVYQLARLTGWPVKTGVLAGLPGVGL